MPHTADVLVEAWGSDFGACCEEAVAGLVGTCLDSSGADIVEERVLFIAPASLDSMLLEVLDAVIFVLDTAVTPPIGALTQQLGDAGLEVRLLLASRDATESIGSAPKAISRSELSVESGPDEVRCVFLVDV